MHIVKQPRDATRVVASTPRAVDHFHHAAADDPHDGSSTVSQRGLQCQRRHRRDGRECFASESERPDADEIVGRVDLRRRVAFDREECIVAAHAGPVVADPNRRPTALVHFDLDGLGAPASIAFSTKYL